ncbi:2-oxoadipate dioxygenase/decarboxylase [Amycolatopsis jejuensis]|uniref:2-oxoadipate dioxygenase/decarboxylase n=1 Tax=Amycolatopsis jejuensis TaxID=330084 RepID=UPI000527F884|nr:VOC family protein [Amycolatopsis jejuensis]
MKTIPQWQLRAAFARRLSERYGREVPAYTTLVDVSREVNEDVLRRTGADAERLGSIERVTAERHGAIRVGTPAELQQVARIFGALGMVPVGFYDLREAAASAVPVVSTAFRPIEADELARNPFRVFTSMLTPADPRFFDDDLRARLENFLGRRRLFPPELLELADRADRDHELSEVDAERFLGLAVGAFELSAEPVDRAWYQELEKVSSVAADIGGVSSTHVNHLTPRVLDIDELYRRMSARGIEMIDAIQGPPRWAGPDVLLRQTSFRALAEPRRMREADGSVTTGALRVRFGEVEARGIALTRKGRERYDELLAETDRRSSGHDRAEVAKTVWQQGFPDTERGLIEDGLAFFTYHLREDRPRRGPTSLTASWVDARPIVYEDFLPRSAAGIFQSNLSGAGTRDNTREGAHYDVARLSGVLERDIHDPYELYERQQNATVEQLMDERT